MSDEIENYTLSDLYLFLTWYDKNIQPSRDDILYLIKYTFSEISNDVYNALVVLNEIFCLTDIVKQQALARGIEQKYNNHYVFKMIKYFDKHLSKDLYDKWTNIVMKPFKNKFG